MNNRLKSYFFKAFFFLILTLVVEARDVVCPQTLASFFSSHQVKSPSKIQAQTELFFRDVIASTLGLYGIQDAYGFRGYEFRDNEIWFPAIKNEKRLKVILNSSSEFQSGILESGDERLLYIANGESKLEAENLLRQALVGSSLHPYISSTLSKSERESLGLPAIMHKDVQSEMLNAALSSIKNRDKKFLIVGPTGIGKTEVFLGVFKARLANQSLKSKIHMVVSDQINLSYQHERELSYLQNNLAFKIIRWGDDAKSFKLDELLKEIETSHQPIVLVTTIQSFKKRFFEAEEETITLLQNKMATIFYDEAHHTGADGAQRVLKTLVDDNKNDVFLLGATATPLHARTSIQEIFGFKAFFAYLDTLASYLQNGRTFREVSEIVKQLKMAIYRGELTAFDRTYLLTPKHLKLSDDQMFVQYESQRYVLNPEAYATLFRRISPLISIHKNGMIAAANISEAKRLELFLNRAFSNAGNKKFKAIHSELTKAEREQIKEDYRQGKIHYLIAVEMMNEGVRFQGMSLYIDLNRNVGAREFLQRIGRVLSLEPGKNGIDIVSLMSLSEEGAEENLALITAIAKGELSNKKINNSKEILRRPLENDDLEFISLDRSQIQQELMALKLDLQNFWKSQSTAYKNGKEVLHWMIEDFKSTGELRLPKKRTGIDELSVEERQMTFKMYNNILNDDFIKAFMEDPAHAQYLRLIQNKIDKLKRLHKIKAQGRSKAYLNGLDVLHWMINNFERTRELRLPKQRDGKDELSVEENQMAFKVYNNILNDDFIKAFMEDPAHSQYLKLIQNKIDELKILKENKKIGRSKIYLIGLDVLKWMIVNFERTGELRLPKQREGKDELSVEENQMAFKIRSNLFKDDFLKAFMEDPAHYKYFKLIQNKIDELKRLREIKGQGRTKAYLNGLDVLHWMIADFERTKEVKLPKYRSGKDEMSVEERRMAVKLDSNIFKDDFIKPFMEDPAHDQYLRLILEKKSK